MRVLRSLGVVLAAALAVLVLTPRPQDNPALESRWTAAYRRVQAVADYRVLAPRALPAGWRATSADVEPPAGAGSASWRVTFATPLGAYAAVAQSDGDTARYVADLTTDGDPAGTATISGSPWQRVLRQTDGADRRSLVRRMAGSVVVVTGTASWEELAELVAALRTA